MSDNAENQRRRDRHKRHRNRDERPQAKPSVASPKESSVQKTPIRTPVRERERREDIPVLPKLPTPLCAKCGEAIQDLASALNDRESGSPVHFDCVLKFLQGAEDLATNERIVYIGQGRFAVMYFENPVDTRKFKIIRTIEWEKREQKETWRTDISGRFSQIK